MSQGISNPISKMLLCAVLFVTLPITVFFIVQRTSYLDITSDYKIFTSQAISAVAAIVTVHVIVGAFLYIAYNLEKVKERTD
jgi:uncharacterized membrane protein